MCVAIENPQIFDVPALTAYTNFALGVMTFQHAATPPAFDRKRPALAGRRRARTGDWPDWRSCFACRQFGKYSPYRSAWQRRCSGLARVGIHHGNFRLAAGSCSGSFRRFALPASTFTRFSKAATYEPRIVIIIASVPPRDRLDGLRCRTGDWHLSVDSDIHCAAKRRSGLPFPQRDDDEHVGSGNTV